LYLRSGYAPNFFCVGEYLPDTIEGVMSNGGPMDGIWHDSFYWKIREAIVFDTVNWEELKNVIDARRQGYKNTTDIVNYQSNHDHDRLLVELGKENFPANHPKKSTPRCFRSKRFKRFH
jgi:1,4-alpha-glucan branching enzyme